MGPIVLTLAAVAFAVSLMTLGSYFGFPIFVVLLLVGVGLFLFPLLGFPFLGTFLGYVFAAIILLCILPFLGIPFFVIGIIIAIMSLVFFLTQFFGTFSVPALFMASLPVLGITVPLFAVGFSGPLGFPMLICFMIAGSLIFL